MENPWIALPETSPFVLEQDKEHILQFNRKAHDAYKIHLELLPEPFLGRPEAPVVLLNLNPGFDPSDIVFHTCDPYFIETSRKNLVHERMDYPFYLLDPMNSESNGHRWWAKRLRRLIADCTLETVAQKVLCIEFFGYHSQKYGFPGHVPSQNYGFHFAREAVKRRAVIIQMRGRRNWLGAVSDLQGYSKHYELNSVRAAYITPHNCPEGYPEIIRALNCSTF